MVVSQARTTGEMKRSILFTLHGPFPAKPSFRKRAETREASTLRQEHM